MNRLVSREPIIAEHKSAGIYSRKTRSTSIAQHSGALNGGHFQRTSCVCESTTFELEHSERTQSFKNQFQSPLTAPARLAAAKRFGASPAVPTASLPLASSIAAAADHVWQGPGRRTRAPLSHLGLLPDDRSTPACQ